MMMEYARIEDQGSKEASQEGDTFNYKIHTQERTKRENPGDRFGNLR